MPGGACWGAGDDRARREAAVDLVPHVSGRDVVFGAGRGELVFESDLFGGLNPEIQAMFYGDES